MEQNACIQGPWCVQSKFICFTKCSHSGKRKIIMNIMAILQKEQLPRSAQLYVVRKRSSSVS